MGHEHVVESLCYGKKPTDASAIMAAAKAAEADSTKDPSLSSVPAAAPVHQRIQYSSLAHYVNPSPRDPSSATSRRPAGTAASSCGIRCRGAVC